MRYAVHTQFSCRVWGRTRGTVGCIFKRVRQGHTGVIRAWVFVCRCVVVGGGTITQLRRGFFVFCGNVFLGDWGVGGEVCEPPIFRRVTQLSGVFFLKGGKCRKGRGDPRGQAFGLCIFEVGYLHCRFMFPKRQPRTRGGARTSNDRFVRPLINREKIPRIVLNTRRRVDHKRIAKVGVLLCRLNHVAECRNGTRPSHGP